MNGKIEDVLEFFENRRDLVEVADGIRPIEFIKHLSNEEILAVVYLLRLRWLINQPIEEEHE